MPHNLISESDKSIEYFSNFLTHLRFLKKIYNEISPLYKSNEEHKNLVDFNKLNDISSLITICHLDLVTNSKNLYVTKSNWEKIFFIKNIFLVIYETINSYHKNSKFLKDKSENSELVLSLFLNSNILLRDFKTNYKYDTHINKIRNKISGHINDNFEEYYDEIINFDAEKTALMTLDFLKIIETIQLLLAELMKEIKFDNSKISSEKLLKLQNILDKL